MNREEGFKRQSNVVSFDSVHDTLKSFGIDVPSTTSMVELRESSHNVTIHDGLPMSIKFDEGVDEIEKYIIDNGKLVGDNKPKSWSKYIIKNDVFMVTRRYGGPGARSALKSTIICDKSSIGKIITKPLMLCNRTVIKNDQEIRDWMSSP